MYRSFIAGIVASTLGLASVVPVTGQPLCHPKLTVTDVQFSEMIPPTLERKWTAAVLVDATRCATASGSFEIGFTQLSEIAPDVDFRQKFQWSSPSVKVAVDFSAYEAVQSYWIDSVQACPCAR